MSRGLPGPFSDDLQIPVIPGGKKKEHANVGQPLLGIWTRQVICHLPNDPVRLWTVQGPGPAVGPQHRNLHADRNIQPLNLKPENTVGGFGLGKKPAQMDPGINPGKLFAVDGFNNLTGLQLTR